MASEAEQAELLKIREEKDAAEERNFRAMEEIMLEGKKIRQQRKEELERSKLEGKSSENPPFESASNSSTAGEEGQILQSTSTGIIIPSEVYSEYDDDSSDDDESINGTDDDDDDDNERITSSRGESDIFNETDAASVTSAPQSAAGGGASPKVGGSSSNSSSSSSSSSGGGSQGKPSTSSKFMNLLSESIVSSPTLVKNSNPDNFESEMNSLD